MENNKENNICIKVDRLTYRNEDNGYTVARGLISSQVQPVIMTGTFPDVRPGLTYEAFGSWETHPQYGRQFQAQRIINVAPKDKKSIYSYLKSGNIEGIGEKTAKSIVDTFGENALEILDSNPDKLLVIPKIGPKKLKKIIQSWKESQSLRDLTLFLQRHEIPLRFLHKINQQYGSDAINQISANPYRLIKDFTGIGFILADRIAKTLGIEGDSTERIEAAIVYLLNQYSSQGHCFVFSEQLVKSVIKLINVPVDNVANKIPLALEELNSTTRIISEKYKNPVSQKTHIIHWLSDLYLAEFTAATKLNQIIQETIELDQARVENLLADYQKSLKIPLSADQEKAVINAVNQSCFVLTGGPGVGKTTTANTIIQLFMALNKRVCLCAPTGRAAQRLSEVSGIEASTIHRLLQWSPETGTFLKNEDAPLDFDVIIVDEASMLDIRLANSLLQASKKHSQIIFIGDVDQLPAVGPGNFLRDLINSEHISVTRLEKVFRQAAKSKIITTAHTINQGLKPEFQNALGDDFKFYKSSTEASIKEDIYSFIENHITSNKASLHDIQILCPMKKGPIGTEVLNKEIQAKFNRKHSADYIERGGQRFTLNDKVIQCTNNYELNVFNGDIGIITNLSQDDKELTVNFHNRDVVYKRDQILDLKLAYAITIHKSQGSEFPFVIIPLTTAHFVMLQRNLIYTGLTRAKKFAAFFGQEEALQIAIKNNKSTKRQTLLTHRINTLANQPS